MDDIEAPVMAFYRHKTISRFQFGDAGRWKSKDFEFVVPEADISQFESDVMELAPIDRNSIMRINKEAMAASETRVSGMGMTQADRTAAVLRGSMEAKDIVTQKDRDAVEAARKAGDKPNPLLPEGSAKPAAGGFQTPITIVS